MNAKTIRIQLAGRFVPPIREEWAVLRLGVKKFFQVDGDQWAGAFAYNAFFSLFPLAILLVTVASAFFERDRAGKEIIAYMEVYIPLTGDMKGYIFETISGVITARGKAGVVALLTLVWVALSSFSTLICVTNRAWGTVGFSWWRLPLRSLILLSIMGLVALVGIGAPLLFTVAKDWLFPARDLNSWMVALGGFVIPLAAVFLCLSLFYSLAPQRPTRFSEVWGAALITTALLKAAETLFGIYLTSFATLNAVYGAFGGIMALLLWIYVSGCLFIFGSCLCAARAQRRAERGGLVEQPG